MLIHPKNSYGPRGKQRTGRPEAQSRDLVKWLKKDPVHQRIFKLPGTHKCRSNILQRRQFQNGHTESEKAGFF
jgi:hypothetical protein